MDENKLLNRIRQSAESVDIPEALTPEQIKMKLSVTSTDALYEKTTSEDAPEIRSGERAADNTFEARTDSSSEDSAEQSNIILARRIYKKWFAAAAVIAAAVISGIAGYSLRSIQPGTSLTADQTESAMTVSNEAGDSSETASTAESSGASDPSGSEASGILSGETDTVALADDVFGVESYESVYDTLKSMEETAENEKTFSGFRLFGGLGSSNGAASDAAGGMAVETEEAAAEYETADANDISTAQSDASGYSTTNIQETGVDEADIIKTDGSYVYILRENNIRILSAKGAGTEHVASIRLQDYADSIKEFYVDGDRLSVIYSSTDTIMVTEDDYYYKPVSDNFTMVDTYDISNPAEPVRKGSTKQNGYYMSSRKVGNILYLFTQYYPDTTDKAAPERYIPFVNDSLISTADICIPEQVSSRDYLVISSVDIRHPDKTVDEKAILSAASDYYVSPNNIYVYQRDWSGGEEKTAFMKFHFNNGKITFKNMCALKGYINDRFSMNEYKGYLRVVMTTYEPQNALYVLDGNMKVIGTIQDIAQGETIQSARFMGDTGYFVTYRNMDPLFSVDLSDPKSPKIIGALKITGFSSYLHFYSENLLLGIGEETDPETGEYYGIKLSMFDISDPADVTEKDKYVIKDSYDCPALYESRALMIDPAKNLFGFALDESYMLFSYDEAKGFLSQYVYQNRTPENQTGSYAYNYYDPYYNRSCYVGDNLYLAYGDTMHVFDMTNGYQELTSVEMR